MAKKVVVRAGHVGYNNYCMDAYQDVRILWGLINAA